MDSMTGRQANGPFNMARGGPGGTQTEITKPVKGLTDFYGSDFNTSSLRPFRDRIPATTTTRRTTLDRHQNKMPELRYRKTYEVPDGQLIPEDVRTSRVCLNAQLDEKPLYLRTWPVEPQPDAFTRCPTHVDPRIGEMTRTFTTRYKPMNEFLR